MEKLEKIIGILENANPSEDEKNYLEKNLTDSEVEKFVGIYNILKKVVAGSEHLDTEILGDYILYKTKRDVSVEYIKIIADKIESHLKICKACTKEYNLLTGELDSINQFLSERIPEKKTDQPAVFLFKRTPVFRYAVAAVMVILVSYFGLRISSDLSTPYYKQQLLTSVEEQNYLTRGRTSILFQKGLNAFENKNYDEAVNFLNEDIVKNQNDKSIFYSYYVLGIINLKTSESDFLGAFPSFDKTKVEKGIKNLETSIEKNNSGYYQNLNLDAHYYIASGYLMLDDISSAKQHLKIVIEKRGKFYKKAAELLKSLENN